MSQTLQRPELLTFDELVAMLKIGRSTLERMKAAGKLPPHVALTTRSHRWRRDDVEAWIAEKARATA